MLFVDELAEFCCNFLKRAMNFSAPGGGLSRFVDKLLGKLAARVEGVHESTSDVRQES
jgi:hypothetical protein